MVFPSLNTTENDMSSMTAGGGGSFSNLNTPVPQTTKSNPPTANASATPSSEIHLPTYDMNDPRAILKALIRFVMRTFYDIPKSLVIEYIYHDERIKQQDLAERLRLEPKVVRSFIQEFKRDKFIIEDHRLESNDGTTGRRNQDQYYYKIDTTAFINVVKYRLINMQSYVENLERQQTYKQSNYRCEQCGKEYTELDVGKLYDAGQNALICWICEGNVHEDVETIETATTDEQMANMSLFNEQMKPLFQILKKIDEIMAKEQQLRNAPDHDFLQQNGNAFSSSATPSNHPLSKDANAANTQRSHASNVFDRTSAINHNIEIIIEKDDDDHYSPMDIDETSNMDSALISSRGPGKPGKKSNKSVQSTAEVATQPISAKMKLANKKVPYEPKPLPHWFIRSTVHDDPEEEHRSKNASLHPTAHSSSISRQSSNSKLTKSTSLNEIKHMLLVHESRRQKTLTPATIEDSSSPPTPIQITKTTDSQ